MAGPASRHHPGWARSCRWRSHHARWAGSTERAWTPGFKFVYYWVPEYIFIIISYILQSSYIFIQYFSYVYINKHLSKHGRPMFIISCFETCFLIQIFIHNHWGWEPLVWGVLATRPRLARWVVASSLAGNLVCGKSDVMWVACHGYEITIKKMADLIFWH